MVVAIWIILLDRLLLWCLIRLLRFAASLGFLGSLLLLCLCSSVLEPVLSPLLAFQGRKGLGVFGVKYVDPGNIHSHLLS